MINFSTFSDTVSLCSSSYFNILNFAPCQKGSAPFYPMKFPPSLWLCHGVFSMYHTLHVPSGVSSLTSFFAFHVCYFLNITHQMFLPNEVSQEHFIWQTAKNVWNRAYFADAILFPWKSDTEQKPANCCTYWNSWLNLHLCDRIKLTQSYRDKSDTRAFYLNRTQL